MNTLAGQPRPLGVDGQRPLRCLERQTRTRAVALGRWAQGQAIGLAAVAERLGIARPTLAHWTGQRRGHRLESRPRGRPQPALEIGLGEQVQELLEEWRGRLGLPSLKDLFPQVPRSMLRDWRDQYLQEHTPWLEHLRWTQAGTVWAADYTQPPVPVDGCYPLLLCVRDLASSQQLLAWPVPEATARFTLAALRYLFALYGPPLVLKTDNGSPFTAQDVQEFLASQGVTPLFSPPLTPRYNGAQEATIGSLKTRVLHLALAAGRYDGWTCDDVEAGLQEANHQARPQGRSGPVPEQLWQQRHPITQAQRSAFLQAVATATAQQQQKLLNQTEPGCRPAPVLGATQRAAAARRAIRRVLIELGFLLARRTMN